MHFGMSQVLRQQPRMILGLQLAGGASESIFPEVESAIRSSKTAQHALNAVAGNSDIEDFASYMDYLVCTVFPEVTPLCFKFYYEEGLPLRDQITLEGRNNMATLLLGALEGALLYYENNFETDWDQIRRLLQMLRVPKIKLYPLGPGAIEELAEAAA